MVYLPKESSCTIFNKDGLVKIVMIAPTTHCCEIFCTWNCLCFNKSCVAQIVALGFEPEAAQAALRKHKNNIQNAVDDLIKHDGVVPSSTEESSSSSGSGKHSAVITSYNDFVLVVSFLSSGLLLWDKNSILSNTSPLFFFLYFLFLFCFCFSVGCFNYFLILSFSFFLLVLLLLQLLFRYCVIISELVHLIFNIWALWSGKTPLFQLTGGSISIMLRLYHIICLCLICLSCSFSLAWALKKLGIWVREISET